jgi:STIP1 family protein 1
VRYRADKCFTAQAQVALSHPNEAYTSALRAYDLCVSSPTATSSASTISALVLKCKKMKWENRERDRIRRRGDLLAELETALEAERATELATAAKSFAEEPAKVAEEDKVINEVYDQKVDDLRTAFAVSNPEHMQKREVPDYLVDTITFEIMHDRKLPMDNLAGLGTVNANSDAAVVTKHGHSYERATLIEHLKRSPTDPLTREPLSISDLRPNMALKQACTEFMETNSGWIYDW